MQNTKLNLRNIKKSWQKISKKPSKYKVKNKKY